MPVIESLALEFDGRAQFVRIDLDEEGAVQEKFGVGALPAYLLFKDGQEVDRIRIPLGWLLESRIRRMVENEL